MFLCSDITRFRQLTNTGLVQGKSLNKFLAHKTLQAGYNKKCRNKVILLV